MKLTVFLKLFQLFSHCQHLGIRWKLGRAGDLRVGCLCSGVGSLQGVDSTLAGWMVIDLVAQLIAFMLNRLYSTPIKVQLASDLWPRGARAMR